MAEAKEIKLKRREARNLFSALQFCKRCDVPAKFRYWLKRNEDNLLSDYNATTEAYLEKDDKGIYKPKVEADFNKHLDEEVTLKVYPVDLPEIKDSQTELPAVTRSMNEQTIIEWLMPIIKDE